MLLTEWNWDTALKVRERDGEKRGMEKGIEQGMEKGKKEDIKNLSEYGMSPDQIAKALKLSLDNVLQYQGQK